MLGVLRRVSTSGARYLLTTYFPTTNNTEAGNLRRKYGDGGGHFSFWPLNVAEEPFGLGPPLLAIGMDGDGWDKSTLTQRVVGLWRLPLWSRDAR